MLEEYKQIYKDNAAFVNGWEKMTRSELCNLYLKYKEENNDLATNCLSGIIYKFWNVINHDYTSQGIKLATEEDCYNWVVDAIMYVLDKHVWTDPNSSLYNDPNAPEKAINVRICSLKNNFYFTIKYMKHKLNYDSYSLDYLMDNENYNFDVPYYDQEYATTDFISEMIVKYFNKKDYFPAFTLDGVLTHDLFIKQSDELDETNSYVTFDIDKLRRFLINLDDTYCEHFSTTYNIDISKVKSALPYIIKMSRDDMIIHVKKLFRELKHNTELKEHVR